MPRRCEIAQAARNFISTPFVHQGRKIGVGIDCAGLPLCVAESYSLLDKEGKPIRASDNNSYGPQPHSDIVLEECKRRFVEIPEVREGCVLALDCMAVACHSAIVVKYPDGGFGMVHADSRPGTGRVVEIPLNDKWRKRIRGIFDYVGIED